MKYYSLKESAGFFLPAIAAGIEADNVDNNTEPITTAGKTQIWKDATSLTVGCNALAL